MMKNKKLIVVFILIVAFLLAMVTCVSASDDVGDLPIIDTNPNGTVENQPANNEPVTNNQDNNAPVVNTNNANGVGNNETLPQTGVAGDTTLFVFIGICIASSIYAYVKIRKYNNIH